MNWEARALLPSNERRVVHRLLLGTIQEVEIIGNHSGGGDHCAKIKMVEKWFMLHKCNFVTHLSSPGGW